MPSTSTLGCGCLQECFSQIAWKRVLDEDARAMESPEASQSPSTSTITSSQLSYSTVNSQEAAIGPE